MSVKIYFNLLFMCGILSQGIIGTATDEDMRESSDILVRQKRVVSHVPGEDNKQLIKNLPYIVIVKFNNRIQCVGSILSHHVVITIPSCVAFDAWRYNVISGASRAERGNSHNVIDIKKHYGGHPHRPSDGIALLILEDPFVFRLTCSPIALHSGPLIPGTLGTVSGWGFNWRCDNRGTMHPKVLRSINVPILSHQDCVNRYLPHNVEIFGDHICTYDPQRYCGHNDGGAPLVIDGRLTGIHLFTGPGREQNDPQYPEVFALLQHYEYDQWIRTNIRDIEAHFENRGK